MLALFALGPPKCGTVSLCHALTTAGVRTTHSRPAWIPRAEHTATLLRRAYEAGRDPAVDMPGVEAIVHACTDTDWLPMDVPFMQTMRAYHPTCVFVLHTRPVDHWIRSLTGWKNVRARITAAALPGLPPGVGAHDAELANWITAHWQHMRQLFAEDAAHFVEIDIENAEQCEARLSAALQRLISWPWCNRSLRGEMAS